MSLFGTAEFLVNGLMGLGFCSLILSYVVQAFYTYASPIMISMGWSYFGMQNFDLVMYACELMIPFGLVCLFLATVIWVANWG